MTKFTASFEFLIFSLFFISLFFAFVEGKKKKSKDKENESSPPPQDSIGLSKNGNKCVEFELF